MLGAHVRTAEWDQAAPDQGVMREQGERVQAFKRALRGVLR